MTQQSNVSWDLDLIRRYDLAGPRYTSYPTAIQFDSGLTADQLIAAGRESADVNAPLSLYVHIPFCAHVCYYCACNKVITRNRKKAQPYLDTLYQEMDQLSQWYRGDRTVNQLHWGGGTPTFISDEQMRELMAALRRNFNLRDDDLGDYSIEIDPREAGHDTLGVLREIGFNRISLGVQDVNLKVQEAVNRVQPTEQTRAVLDRSRELGFKSINMDLIYGLPHQTEQSFEETLDTVIAMSPDRLSVFNYAHLPDRFRSQKHIRAEDLPSAEEKLAILQNSINRLLDAGYVYIGMDHFAKPDDELAIAQQSGKLHRNFQGYTTHADCDLVAMGVSAISQIGNVYYQNEHDISAYSQAVLQQQHAVKRGVELNFDDHIRRAVITELICQFKLDKKAVEQRFDIDFDQYFADEQEELLQFNSDGLVHLSPTGIEVTPAGRLLIRRICMAFDAYIPKKQHSQNFSRII
ncbi:oxygen-independent coproporphyrinogen III oxidase [Marinobacterium sediminicola]|uniref:Coproporphyrinogen-III oxidase n=1 Tax=Marinobacterium sediminicola TaxID=518898 RepID=A0ABY1RVP0_9GAMM|nr:oxygen-independent coproporphyrinogen III oxidase [Marinobacterium sediminicola]ULG70578.1 oxygen-independent coproporphyrinogen III oxidase [Marinobacterium sediminicola]SMR68956.1 oxygen-independent coproporphyrinogen-3 oxidase [Marinobacterium sediminicola]